MLSMKLIQMMAVRDIPLTATVYIDKVVGITSKTANILVNVDESLSANMRFDGSSISGKAQAGATITIEVI